MQILIAIFIVLGLILMSFGIDPDPVINWLLEHLTTAGSAIASAILFFSKPSHATFNGVFCEYCMDKGLPDGCPECDLENFEEYL